MIVRVLAGQNDKVVVIPNNGDDDRFLRKNPTGGFMKVDSLPQAEYSNWLMVNGEIVVDVASEIKARMDEITLAIKSKLDELALSYRYDDMVSARSYAGWVNDFQAEAISLAEYSALIWQTAGGIGYQVATQAIPVPTIEEALAMLPEYVPL